LKNGANSGSSTKRCPDISATVCNWGAICSNLSNASIMNLLRICRVLPFSIPNLNSLRVRLMPGTIAMNIEYCSSSGIACVNRSRYFGELPLWSTIHFSHNAIT